MSQAADEPRAAPVRVQALLSLSLEDVTATKDPRLCDGCGEEQLFGCVAAVYLGVLYRELCVACLDALASGIEKARRAKT